MNTIPPLSDWRKDNPGKTLNDYFAIFPDAKNHSNNQNSTTSAIENIHHGTNEKRAPSVVIETVPEANEHQTVFVDTNRSSSNPNMDASVINNIKNLVSKNSTSDALTILLELSLPNKEVHDAIHIILGEFNSLTAQRLRGTIDNGEVTRRLNSIHDRILIALDSFDSQGKPLPNHQATGGKNAIFLKRYGFILLIIAIFLGIFGILLGLTGIDFLTPLAMIMMFASYYIGIISLILLGGWLLSVIVNALKGR